MVRSYTGKSLAETDDSSVRASQVDRSSIDTLQAGQGAQVTTRANASEAASKARANAQKRSNKARLSGSNRPRYGTKRNETTNIDRSQILILAVAAFVVIGILGFLLSRALGSLTSTPSANTDDTQTTQSNTIAVSAPGTGGVELSAVYDDATITVEKFHDGTYGIMATGADATNPLTLFTVSGEPAALIINGRTFIVPENLDGGWDIVSFTWGADALPERVVGEDGSPVQGQGSVVGAELADGILTITSSSGETTQIPLD